MHVFLIGLMACSGSDPQPTPMPPAPTDAATAQPMPIADAAAEPIRLSTVAVPELPDLRTAGTQHLQLHRMTGRYEIARPKLPPKVAAMTAEFVLEHEEMPNPRGAPRVLKVLKAPLPFAVSDDDQTFRPVGMRVYIGQEELSFTRVPAPQAKKSTWRVTGKSLILSHPTVPPAGAVKLIYPGIEEVIDRHDPEAGGLSPEEFVRYDVTLNSHTRHGLLLPAPAAAAWDVTLPTGGATFEGWLAIEPSPLDRPRSDGAEVALSIEVDGSTVEVDRKVLKGTTANFVRWRVDLSRWEGKEAVLRLSSEAGGKGPVFDWVFVGSPTVWGPPKGEPRRIVVVAMDTTRPDHFGFNGYRRDTTPELDAVARSSFVFDSTWAPAPRTRPSFRSATTGRRPLEAVGAKNIGEVFQEHGFATAGIVANVHLQPRFDFDHGFDSWHFDGRHDAEQQVDMALEWLQANSDRDTYLFLHFMDAHMIYDAPGEFRNKFVTDPDPTLPKRVKRGQVLNWMKSGQVDDRRKKHLEALHDGEMAYMSRELGRLYDGVDDLGGKSLVVLHSDHGEEFWEHGGFEHNHTLYDEVTRAVLWVRPGGGLAEGKRLSTPATLIDIGPTLYDLLGFADSPGTDGRSLMPLLAGETAWEDRPLPVAHLQYSHERWGVVWQGHKYILHTGSGREELYNLSGDAKETSDLSKSVDLAPYRVQLRAAHGIPVGPGFRLRITLDEGAEGFTLTLPTPATTADVLDPETAIEHRANVEWGEVPKRLPADIGTVELSQDNTAVTFSPGRDPNGIVYVLFEEPVDPAEVTLSVGGETQKLTETKRGPMWKAGNRSVLIEPGTIVVPGPTEADRMGIGPGASGAEDEMKMLRELGYIGDDDEG